MKNKMIIFILALTTLLFFSGCFSIGANETYCQEHGCDFHDAGVCGNSYDIYKNWKEAEKEAYKGYDCKQGDFR